MNEEPITRRERLAAIAPKADLDYLVVPGCTLRKRIKARLQWADMMEDILYKEIKKKAQP